MSDNLIKNDSNYINIVDLEIWIKWSENYISENDIFNSLVLPFLISIVEGYN